MPLALFLAPTPSVGPCGRAAGLSRGPALQKLFGHSKPEHDGWRLYAHVGRRRSKRRRSL